MARGAQQDDDDDFMDAPQQNHPTGRAKDSEEKKKRHRNTASQECLTILNEGFTDEHKGATGSMGMQALMDVRCKNLVNPVCDWLGEIYDPASREFVIPGRGRLPLDEESVFCTLGVPRGEIKVPYEVNNKIEEALFPRLFPGMSTMPNTTVLATSLEGMTSHGELMYVDSLDLSTVDFTGIGGLPPAYKFDVSAWTDVTVKAVLATDRITDTKYGKLQLMAKNAIDYSVFGGPQNFGKWMDVHSAPSCPTEARAPIEHLVGQFASGMTSLLGKLVEGWTTLNGSDNNVVARQFTSFVEERTHRPTGCHGRYDYNSSQELPDTQDDLDGDAGLDKDETMTWRMCNMQSTTMNMVKFVQVVRRVRLQ
ncbi:hypothetical protein VPH35_054789 [Triticum aestivum]|uniref:Uncharacterized protein n=2 Tax=Triticum TaxID=4564 RepID=A0A9R1S8J2_TRITD|nr:unnamed protein product [Triticum aestivum]VAH83653.1 unnamed protein product [Triticum turgidum subsp. durum]